MSGGHWDYDDQRISDFGERLQRDDEPLVRALGSHLIAIGGVLHEIDWNRSGDSGPWDRSRLMALLPAGAAIESARKDAELAVQRLAETIALSRRPPVEGRS